MDEWRNLDRSNNASEEHGEREQCDDNPPSETVWASLRRREHYSVIFHEEHPSVRHARPHLAIVTWPDSVTETVS